MSTDAINDPHDSLEPRPAKLDDLIPLFGGGFALGGVAILACALIDAMAIAAYENVGRDDAQSWPIGAVIALGVFAVLVSLFGARWILGLRRWIGAKNEPESAEMVRRKRRSFTLGAMIIYVLVTPLVWVLVVAIAISAT